MGRISEEGKKVLLEVCKLLHSYGEGRLISEGFSLGFLGATNVGKSSLFNALVREDRAIVTREPGTTRDFVSVSRTLCGQKVQFLDTAGFRETENLAEQKGMERARSLIPSLDTIFLVMDRGKSSQVRRSGLGGFWKNLCGD